MADQTGVVELEKSAGWLLREVRLRIGGCDRPLVFDFAAIAEAYRIGEVNLFRGGLVGVPEDQIAVLAYVAMRRGSPGLTLKQVEEMISFSNLREVVEALERAFEAAITPLYAEGHDEPAAPAQSEQRGFGEQYGEIWAKGRYDLGLKAREFGELTPNLFELLWRRHQEHLLHREMIGAFTTAAVVNYSMMRPEEWVDPVRYMPNHRQHAATEIKASLTEEQQEAKTEWHEKVMQLAAEMKVGHGVLLERVKRGESV